MWYKLIEIPNIFVITKFVNMIVGKPQNFALFALSICAHEELEITNTIWILTKEIFKCCLSLHLTLKNLHITFVSTCVVTHILAHICFTLHKAYMHIYLYAKYHGALDMKTYPYTKRKTQGAYKMLTYN